MKSHSSSPAPNVFRALSLPIFTLPFLLPLLVVLFACLPGPARAAPPVEVRVTPAGAVLGPTETLVYSAMAIYEDGSERDITAEAQWSTSDSSTARIGVAPQGPSEVLARDPGTVEIRAAIEEEGTRVKGATLLLVDAGAVTGLSTRPSSKNLEVGQAMQFKARATYESGWVGDVTEQVDWASTDTSVATVDATGLVTPKRVGDQTIIRAVHRESGVANTDEDGRIRVRAAVDSIDFDDDYLWPNLTTLGAGMKASVDVYGYRADGSRSNITRDCIFEISGDEGIIRIYGDGEDPEHEAGDIVGLSDGLVLVTARDPERGLVSANPIVVVVSGVLEGLEISPDPFKVSVGDQRTAKVYGRLSSGLKTPDLRKVVLWETGRSKIATVGQTSADYGKVTGVKAGETTLRAIEPSTGLRSEAATIRVLGTITGLSVTPDPLHLARGMRVPMRAYVERDDGTRSNVTSSVEWDIQPPGVAFIDEENILTAVSDGVASIVARRGIGTEDELVSPPTPLTVAGTLVELRIEPDPFAVRRDRTRKPRVFGGLSTGETTSDLREVVWWQVDDTSLAIVGNGVDIPTEESPLENGEVLGIEPGLTTLRATEPGSGIRSTQEGNLRILGDIREIVLEGNEGLVPVDRSVFFAARAALMDGSTALVNDRCDWSIDDPEVASVVTTSPNKGMVTGLRVDGRTTLRAVCEGLEQQTEIHVVGEITSLRVSPRSFTGRAGESREISASAVFSNGTKGPATEAVDWSTDNAAVASVDNSPGRKGTVRFHTDGVARITAHDAAGAEASAEIEVTGSIVELNVGPGSVQLPGSMGRRLRAKGRTSDGRKAPANRRVTWSSSDEEIAAMSTRPGQEDMVIAGAKRGIAVLTATFGPGVEGSTEVIVGPLLSSLRVEPGSRTIEVGRSRNLRARGYYEDEKSKSLTRFVDFVSDDPSIARIESSGRHQGRVIGIAPGVTAIRAFDPTTGLESENAAIIEVVSP
jgi:uncharacterized protein YjdB